MDFKRHNLTSTDVRFWRIKSTPAPKDWTNKMCCHTSWEGDPSAEHHGQRDGRIHVASSKIPKSPADPHHHQSHPQSKVDAAHRSGSIYRLRPDHQAQLDGHQAESGHKLTDPVPPERQGSRLTGHQLFVLCYIHPYRRRCTFRETRRELGTPAPCRRGVFSLICDGDWPSDEHYFICE